MYSNCYVESYRCNLLGLPPTISIPPHVNTSEPYLVVDIFDPEPGTASPGSFLGYRFQVSSSASLDKGMLSHKTPYKIVTNNNIAPGKRSIYTIVSYFSIKIYVMCTH